MRPGGVDVCRDVEFAQLFVERIPVAVAQRRRFRAAVLERVRVEQHTAEAQLFYAAFQFGQHHFDRIAGHLRQAADPDEALGQQLYRARDDVVGFLGEPVHQLAGLGAVHHLERAR
ncbi:hypothetical protein D3C72_1788420 [compost metagenome]